MTQNQSPNSQAKKVGGRILAVTVSLGALLCVLGMSVFMTSGNTRTIDVNSRIFTPLSIEYIGEYQLPNNFKVKDTPVGGLSGLTYDKTIDRFYAVSDDRSQKAPARFYTLKLDLDTTNLDQIKFRKVDITDVTIFKNSDGKTYEVGTIDPRVRAGGSASPNSAQRWAAGRVDRKRAHDCADEGRRRCREGQGRRQGAAVR